MSGPTRTVRAGFAVSMVLALAGTWIACRTPLDRAYGLSQRAHVAATTANPDAGKKDPDAPHPDGKSTEAAVQKMREREVEATREPERVINVDIGN